MDYEEAEELGMRVFCDGCKLPPMECICGMKPKDFNMPETIQIPRAWLERLIVLNDEVAVFEGHFLTVQHLVKHIESAKSLLDK